MTGSAGWPLPLASALDCGSYRLPADDQVDALRLIGQLLDQMVPGQKPKTPEKPKNVDTGYRPIPILGPAG
jgi:hypothetical protein